MGEDEPIKADIARALCAQGYTQNKISRLLGITQPMVSKYLQSKKIKNNYSQVIDLIKRHESVSFNTVISAEPLTKGSYHITPTEQTSGEEAQILGDIKDAVSLMSGVDFSSLLPKVKVNIAVAKNQAVTKHDVAALPSGIIFDSKQAQSFASPSFSSSSHLATLLLKHKQKSVMNVKYSADILKKIKTRYSHAYLLDDYSLERNSSNKELDVMIHRGSFGIEPSTYIFGNNAKEVVQKCLHLL